jgi:uncharacterized phiE125 gp8 family phage protein
MATGDLTTLAAVQEHRQKLDTTNTTQDAIIASLITTASSMITNYTQREFIGYGGATSTPSARTYRYEGRGVLPLGQDDAQTVTQVRIDTDTDDPTTLEDTQYKLSPTRRRDGVITALHLINLPVAQRTVQGWPIYREVEVTGTWGWPEVPDQVERACILLVMDLLSRTSSWRGGDEDLMPSPGGVAMPLHVRTMLAPYRRRALGV